MRSFHFLFIWWLVKFQMTKIYHKKYKEITLHSCNNLPEFFLFDYLSASPQICLPLTGSRPLCYYPVTDNILPSFTPVDSLTNHVCMTMFVVKSNKSCWLQGTLGELTQSEPWRPWRPSDDKALLIQMNRTPSEGDLSMCQLPTSQTQITSTGQTLGIYRESSGLGQHSKDPQ